MASNVDKFPSTLVDPAERNAKSATARGHARHSASRGRAAAGNKNQESAHWPIVDLIKHQSHKSRAGAITLASTSYGPRFKPNSGTEDIDLSATVARGKRTDLRGSNMPQSLVAKAGDSYKGMKPIERFVAETYGQYMEKAAAAKPRV